MSTKRHGLILTWLAAMALIAAACAPAAPSPTVAPARPTEAPKPAPTAAPAKPTVAAKPAATAAPAKPAASPAAKAEAKPAPSPAPKAAFDEKTIADFFRGKTLKIVVGAAPGGSFDTWSRLLARHMPRYLPGSPTIIVENKPGAGSVLAANAIYNTEAKDGTVMGTAIQNIIIQQAVGAAGVQFDGAKFKWLGSTVKASIVGVARQDAGVAKFEDVLNGKELVVGALAPGSTLYDVPAVIKAALGANFKIVTGYSGLAPVMLALQGGEVNTMFMTSDDLNTTGQQILAGDKPLAKAIIVTGSQTPDHPLLKGVPAVETLAKTTEARQLLRAVHAPSQISNPYMVAPEVPQDRAEALRKAFSDVFRDQEFLAEAKKAGLNPQLTSGEEVTRIVQDVLSTPKDVLAKLAEMLK